MKTLAPSIIALLALLLSTVLVAEDQPLRVEHFVGEARANGNGELVYTEHHRREWRGDEPVRMLTTYKLPDDSVLAEREVRYLERGVVEFALNDKRIGYMEGAERDNGRLRLFSRENESASKREDTIRLRDELVVDAGFDRMVALNWESLMAGESVSARFAVPSRRSDYRCEISKQREWELDGEPVVTFRMRFRGLLLSLFADPVDVTYHRESKALVRYEGISNLRDESGDNYQVVIDLPLAKRSFEQ